MTTRWHAPGRVNLIGEHTDYNEGFALPFAIEAGCVAEVTKADQFVVRSAQEPVPVTLDRTDFDVLPELPVPGWVRYVLGPAWALARRGYDVPPLAVDVDSAVPVGAGLSSSAAVICSVAAAVDELLECGLGPDELLAVTRSAENDVAGAPTGGLDQLASLRCTEGHVLLCDFRDLSTEQVPFVADGLTLLVVDTGSPHQHTGGEYAARRHACEAAAAALGLVSLRDADPRDVDRLDEDLRRHARHVVTENHRVRRTADLLRRGRIWEIGPLLSASHASMRDDFRISTPAVDLTVEALENAGALGARLTGGGFGGCVIALVPTAVVERAVEEVTASYAEAGLPRPRFVTTRPSAGARPL